MAEKHGRPPFFRGTGKMIVYPPGKIIMLKFYATQVEEF
jgi:hypothetical protein